jgi:hypothetical protein
MNRADVTVGTRRAQSPRLRRLAVKPIDTMAEPAQSAVMRTVLALGFLTLLVACSGDPRSFGITGPGAEPAPAAPATASPDTAPMPGVATTGPTYGPSTAPSTGNSGFWGYN